MAGFIQIIKYKTSHPDEVKTLGDKFRQERMDSGDKAPMTNIYMTKDRDEKDTYRTIVRFNSYEEAMANSNRPDTNDFSKRMAELCDGPPEFSNLDIWNEESY